MARRSIRAFKADPVDHATMDTILKCAINAPNAMNAQSWAIRVSDDSAFLAGINDTFREAGAKSKNARMAAMATSPNFKGLFYGAPTVVFIATDDGRWSGFDCGMMCENLMISAKSCGVGTVALGSPTDALLLPEEAGYLAKLNIPEGYHLALIIAMGYPHQSPEAKPRDAGKIQWIK